MSERPEHNAADLNDKETDASIYGLKASRVIILALINFLKALPLTGRNVSIAITALEDARLRCGLSLEPFNDKTGFVRSDTEEGDSLIDFFGQIQQSVQARETQLSE